MKKVIAMLLAAFMLVGYIPVVSADGNVTEVITVPLVKDDKPFTEQLEIEVLDGGAVVETVTSSNGMVFFTKCETGKTYMFRLRKDSYEFKTKYMKVVNKVLGKDNFTVAYFLEDENEELSDAKTQFIILKDKEMAPKKDLQAMLTKDNLPVMDNLEVEVWEGESNIGLLSFNGGVALYNQYEVAKTYTLRLNSHKYELVTKYMNVVQGEDGTGLHFLETVSEQPASSNAMLLKIKDKATAPGPQPGGENEADVLKELPIKVEHKGRPVPDFKLGVHVLDIGIYNLMWQLNTNEHGVVILKNLAPNADYMIHSRVAKKYFEQDSFHILTNEKGEIKSINGKNVKEFPHGIIFKMVDKNDSSIKKIVVTFKTVDKKTGEPVKAVVLTANTINPNLGSFQDATSDEEGNVKFELLGAENGKNYSITVSKNAQFLWDFEPEEIEVVVNKDGYKILSTKGNEQKGNTLGVTFNDRRHLRDDLSKLIKKAEELMAGDKYKTDYKYELSRAVLGGKMELEKAETLPFYVEGHITNIETLIKKLILKEEVPKTQPSNPGNHEVPKYNEPIVKHEEPTVEPKKDTKKDAEKRDKDTKVIEPKVEKTIVREIVINPPTVKVEMVDLPETPARNAVQNIVARGIMVGTGKNKFEPELPVSRAMVTEVLMRLAADKFVDENIVFTDLKNDSWFSKSVKWAATHKIVRGFGDGTFRANKKVSLQEFAYMLKDYGLQLPKKIKVDKTKYGFLPEWSRDAVIGLVEAGLIEVSQTGQNKFDGDVSREYLAVVLDRLIQFTEENQSK